MAYDTRQEKYQFKSMLQCFMDGVLGIAVTSWRQLLLPYMSAACIGWIIL